MTTVTITRNDLKSLKTLAQVSISDVDQLSSYNWIESATPTIVVPGCPNLWTPPAIPRQLQKDSGRIYIAQNAARHPESPLEPLFRALLITRPTFELQGVDVITDRNNLRKLLSFVSNGPTGRDHDPFTIKFELVKNTLIMCRDEAATEEFLGPNDFRGFGHEFEKVYTTAQVPNSTGHHRIISYRFANMAFIIRHETDGCVETSQTPNGTHTDDDSLTNLVGKLSLSAAGDSSYDTYSNSKLRLNRSGSEVSLESTLEIKTRAIARPLELGDVAAQLWISQTPRLVRAYHRQGKFQAPEVENVIKKIRQWEDENQGILAQLGALIEQIVKIAKQLGGKAYTKYDPIYQRLMFYRYDGKPMLPEDIYSLWEKAGNLDSKAETRQTVTSTCAKDTTTDVKFADIIPTGKEKGFRWFFRAIQPQLFEFRTLCQSLDAQNVDVLAGRQIREIMEDMRKGKSDWDPDERRQIDGLKRLARDSAFRLLYVLLQGKEKDKNKAFNATLFVVSHRRIFGYRPRKMVRMAFLEQFSCSDKQRKELDKWPLQQDGSRGSDEDDATTEAEDLYYDFDSDDSW